MADLLSLPQGEAPEETTTPIKSEPVVVCEDEVTKDCDETAPEETGPPPKLALLSICRSGDYDKALTLLERGADPNLPDRHGTTPVMACAFGGHFKLMKMLIDQKADANMSTDTVKTALSWAQEEAPPYSYDDSSLGTSDGDRRGCMARRRKIANLLLGVPDAPKPKPKQAKGGKAGYHQTAEANKESCACVVS